MTAHKQSRLDSLMETFVNVGIGWLFSLVVLFIIGPWFGFKPSAGEGMAFTGLFTLASIIRQYLIRRLFAGTSPYERLRGLFAS